jgi:hypothetical protein
VSEPENGGIVRCLIFFFLAPFLSLLLSFFLFLHLTSYSLYLPLDSSRFLSFSLFLMLPHASSCFLLHPLTSSYFQVAFITPHNPAEYFVVPMNTILVSNKWMEREGREEDGEKEGTAF